MGWIILGVIIALIVGNIIASEFRKIAEQKGYDGEKYFWYTFLFGICGMLMVVALPDKNSARNATKTDREDALPTVSSEPKEEPIVQAQGMSDVNRGETPVDAVICDDVKRCPKCGRLQRLDRSVCWNCGQQFNN